MKILVRYITRELVVSFAVWVIFLFLLLFVMQFLRGTEVLLGSAVTALDLGRVALCLTPHFLVMAIPIALLLSILLGLGRFAEDRELTALAALGMSPGQIVVIPVVLSFALGGLMVFLSFTLEPLGLASLRGVVNELIKRNVVGEVKPGVFYEDLSEFTMYAEKVDETTGTWTNVMIHDDRDRQNPLLMLAREARVNPRTAGQAVSLGLLDGTVHHTHLGTENYTLVSYERGEVVVGVEESIFRKNRFRSAKEEFTPAELLQLAREAEASGEDPKPWYMAYHWRFGQALSPVAFALLGVALAMSRTGGRGRAFLLSILGYVAYYVLSRLFENLGTQGKVPFLVAGQITNVVFAIVGLYLLSRVARAGTVRG